MSKNPASGNGPTMPDEMSSEAVNARIAQFCAWFGAEPVKLRLRKGRVVMTDALLHWCEDEGASLDWILLGDGKCMAASFRRDYAFKARLNSAMERLDDTERQIFERCLIDMDEKIKAHRAAHRKGVTA